MDWGGWSTVMMTDWGSNGWDAWVMPGGAAWKNTVSTAGSNIPGGSPVAPRRSGSIRSRDRDIDPAVFR